MRSAIGLLLFTSTDCRTFDTVPPHLERPYDITRDGQRFVGLANATDGAQPAKGVTPQIRVVLNWREELKRLRRSRHAGAEGCMASVDHRGRRG